MSQDWLLILASFIAFVVYFREEIVLFGRACFLVVISLIGLAGLCFILLFIGSLILVAPFEECIKQRASISKEDIGWVFSRIKETHTDISPLCKYFYDVIASGYPYFQLGRKYRQKLLVENYKSEEEEL